MPQQCGACAHRHQVLPPPSGPPVCQVCGCARFRLHGDELAALDAAEAADVAAFAGRPRILTGYTAHSVTQVLVALEAALHEGSGWHVASTFGVLHLSMQAAPDAAIYSTIVAESFQAPAALCEVAGGDPARFIVTAASLGEGKPSWFDRFRESCGLDPAQPVIGWWSITAFDIVEQRTGQVMASVRELVCVDVDERVYTVVRHRPLPGVSGLGVRVSLDTAPDYRVKAQPMIERGALVAGPVTGLPLMVEGLLRCVRLCHSEQQLRAIAADGAPDDE